MIPGAKQLTLIFSSPSSTDSALVSPNKAVLLTEYAPYPCISHAVTKYLSTIATFMDIIILAIYNSTNPQNVDSLLNTHAFKLHVYAYVQLNM